jgi:predicted TIM-barrel fold metal-dependent hydrolase
MRQGFRVIDSDTHVNPSLDVLLRYADKDLQQRLDDLQPYRRTVKTVAGRGDAEDVGSATILSVKPVRLQRVAGAKAAPAAAAEGDRGFLSGRTQMVTRQPITARVAEDNGHGRLRDMDLEGRDIDFIIPGPWAYGAPALAPHLAHGLYRAYHRYMADYCAPDTRRLKSMILALASDPGWSAQTIKQHAREDWVAAVWPLLPEGMPIDDPDLEPIWAAADEADLPIMYHAFTIETPYFPGYRDIWDNPAMGRCAGQTWGGQRFLSFMLMGGMLDRYPRLRVGALESGHGWLPHWLVRLTRQIDYVRGSVSPALKHTPLEYAQAGRVFVSIDLSEGVALTKAAIDLLGDHLLMFASDYPHPETIFPDHADSVIAWREVLGEQATRKLMWENASRFLRLTSTPWSATP